MSDELFETDSQANRRSRFYALVMLNLLLVLNTILLTFLGCSSYRKGFEAGQRFEPIDLVFDFKYPNGLAIQRHFLLSFSKGKPMLQYKGDSTNSIPMPRTPGSASPES